MAYKVALIGCGALGSRHLQALKKTQRDIIITVCEPSEEAREIAIERYNQIPANEHIKNFSMIADYKELEKGQDFVVVATSSGCRYEITRWLLEEMSVRYILLEKVVFQKLEYFDRIEEMLKKNDTKIWVNCGRRMMTFYKDLKELLKNEKRVDMCVKGTNWGMGCNSIHMLDTYEFITDFHTSKFVNTGLLPELYDSKRPGYKELFGEYVIETDRGNLTLQCEQGEEVGMHISIDSENLSVEIAEADKVAEIVYKKDDSRKSKPIDVDFQSNITNKLAEEILDDGQCELACYEESAELHRLMLDGFLEHMSTVLKEEVTLCPIT